MRLLIYSLGVLFTLGITTGLVAAADLTTVADTLHRNFGYELINVEDYDAPQERLVRLTTLVPVLDQLDPMVTDVLRLFLAKQIADQNKPDLQNYKWSAPTQTGFLPKVTATSYLVYDLDNDSVVMAKDHTLARPIASITKLFTSMVAYDQFVANQRFVMSAAAKTAGSTSYLSIGESFSLYDALSYLHIRSANDVANQLQITYDNLNYPGAFINRMNQKAAEIGLNHTVFQEPTGLSAQNKSSAEDLIKTLLYMRRHYPELLALSRQPAVIRDGRVLENSNPMGKHSNIFRGGKNGWISASGRTLASLVEYNGREYAVVTLNSDFNDEARDTLRLLTAL